MHILLYIYIYIYLHISNIINFIHIIYKNNIHNYKLYKIIIYYIFDL
jgi:hypothetical protein